MNAPIAVSTRPAIERYEQSTNLINPQRLIDTALHEPASRFLSRCGKRIRAAIIDESFRLAGGQGNAPAKIVDAIELLHAGSLIVDDIQDESQERRGQKSLHLEIGLPLALNAGNWMYFEALEKLCSVSSDFKNKSKTMPRVIRSIRECHEGQALDLYADISCLPLNEFLPTARKVSRLKTGGLTALSSWLGALAAGGSTETLRAVREFGMSVGVCLQMHNDLKELRDFASSGDRWDDLKNRRVTWPWAWAVSWGIDHEVVELREQLVRTQGDMEEARSVARRLVSIVNSRGQALINRRIERSLKVLETCCGSIKENSLQGSSPQGDLTEGMRGALSKLCV